MTSPNTLAYQVTVAQTSALRDRIGAALTRHAVYLVTKVTPTATEILWQRYVLGGGYSTMLERAVRYFAAKPAVYQAVALDEVTLTDAALMAIVPELPDALLTT